MLVDHLVPQSQGQRERVVTAENREKALQFGREYFDGSRDRGYGGYVYDGRWVQVAKNIVRHYGLSRGSRVLDIGCAKGYLVKDLLDLGMDAWGVDVSEYAIEHCHPDVVARVTSCHFPNGPALWHGRNDLVVSINTLHNLDRPALIKALREMSRIGWKQFVQVDAYTNARNRDAFLRWQLTAKTHGTPEFWQELFKEAGYGGDFAFTLVEPERGAIYA